MQKNEYSFNGTLVKQKTYPVYFELKENDKPICSQTYKVPNLNEEMSKKQVDNLVLLGETKKENDS